MRRRLVFFLQQHVQRWMSPPCENLNSGLVMPCHQALRFKHCPLQKQFKKDKQHLQICFNMKIGQPQTLWGLKVLEDNTPTVSSPWKCHLQQRGLCDPKSNTRNITNTTKFENAHLPFEALPCKWCWFGWCISRTFHRQENSKAKAPRVLKYILPPRAPKRALFGVWRFEAYRDSKSFQWDKT